MPERWVIAFEPLTSRQGRFALVRDLSGDIMVFGSQGEARRWFLTRPDLEWNRNEVVFLRISSDPQV
jgi:uncharacterized protein (DUF2384 family)